MLTVFVSNYASFVDATAAFAYRTWTQRRSGVGLVRRRLVRGHDAGSLLARNAHWHIARCGPDHHPSSYPTEQRTLELPSARRPDAADRPPLHLSLGVPCSGRGLR